MKKNIREITASAGDTNGPVPGKQMMPVGAGGSGDPEYETSTATGTAPTESAPGRKSYLATCPTWLDWVKG